MRRTPRNAPLWIFLGAAIVILAATFSTRAATQRPEKAATPDVASKPIASGTLEPAPAVTAALDPVLPAMAPRESAPAGEASLEVVPESEPTSAEPAGVAGMVVGIDPETGKLGMPSREFRDAMQESHRNPALSRSMEGIQVIHKPDGSKMVDLRDRFQDYSIVRIAPDGRKEQLCVQGPEVEAALQGKTNADSDSDPTPESAER